jgi:hypothetical protein
LSPRKEKAESEASKRPKRADERGPKARRVLTSGARLQAGRSVLKVCEAGVLATAKPERARPL